MAALFTSVPPDASHMHCTVPKSMYTVGAPISFAQKEAHKTIFESKCVPKIQAKNIAHEFGTGHFHLLGGGNSSL